MTTLHRLLPLFERARAADEPLVLATVINTGGSTYAKPGAHMLIATDGEYAGLLSGGCLEGDLREHARGVANTGEARIVSYDLRSTHDQLFGLGAGCEGAMDILLSRVSALDGWQPLAHMVEAFLQGQEQRIAFVTQSHDARLPLGSTVALGPVAGTPVNGTAVPEVLQRIRTAACNGPSIGALRLTQPDVEIFVAPVVLPPSVLLLGGGPDARPVAELAAFLGWRLTVVDHRPAYLEPARFPSGVKLVQSRAAELVTHVDLDAIHAAIVMSHHLDSDLAYLRVLAGSKIPYVGLLGPTARREKLLGDLGGTAELLRSRLRAPIGLDIGGRAPESIALSIVGEVHAALAGRLGRPFTETAGARAVF